MEEVVDLPLAGSESGPGEPKPPLAEGSGPSGRRRALWGGADQLIYGLTNLVLAIIVAGSVSAREFGGFSVVLVAYTITLGVVQGLTSEVFTVRFSATPPPARAAALARASGAAVGIGVVVGGVALAATLVARGPVVAALWAFAVIVPALYLQDLWRFALFAVDRPRAAVANDLLWALVQGAALVLVRVAGSGSVPAYILAWGAGAVAGAALGALQLHVRPRPLATASWLREHRATGGRFAGEFLTLFGSAQLVLAILAATAGLTELARVRAGQVLFSPVQGILNAVRLSFTPVAVGVWVRRPTHLRRFTLRLSLALTLIALVSGLAALLIPDSAGRALLGQSWNGVRAVLVPLAVLNVALAASLGPLTALRATHDPQRSFKARSATAALVVVFGSAGALVAGAPGAAWGMGAAGLAGLVLVSRYAAASVASGLTSPTAPPDT